MVALKIKITIVKNLIYLLFFVGFGIKAQEISLKKDTEIILGDTIKFDEIVYYKINTSFNTFRFRYKKKYSPKKKLIHEIVSGDVPKSIRDTLFVEDLEKLNFHKEKLEIYQIQKIAEIYSRGSRNYDVACVKNFRDILVFKKKNTIIGVSKICFDCSWETTLFNEYRYYNLIDITYFEELEKLLNSKLNSD